MKEVEVTLKSTAPISFSKFHNVPKENEDHDEYEERTWPEKAHYNEDDEVIIPGNMFKQAFFYCAKYLSIPLTGKSQAKYTKHFESGIKVIGCINTGVKKGELAHEWLYLPSDGTKGGAKRVPRCFPVIKRWKGKIRVLITDPQIYDNMHVFERVCKGSGLYTGIGRWRPANGGDYGTFEVVSIKDVNSDGGSKLKRR